MNKILKLALAGLFAALDIIFARFIYVYLPPGSHMVRLSPQFLAHALAGWLLGPIWAAGSAVAGDLLGMLINSAGLSILPGYTVSAGLTGLLYGLFLYKKPVSAWRCLLAVSAVTLFVSLGLGSLWFTIYFSAEKTAGAFMATVLAALPWRLVSIPIYAAGLFAVQKGLSRAKVLKI